MHGDGPTKNGNLGRLRLDNHHAGVVISTIHSR